MGAAIGAAFLLVAPQAHADDGSYIRFLNEHGITIGMTNTPASQLAAGRMVCDNLRGGADPHAGMNFLTRGLVPDAAVNAAQHELCPDTLH